MACLRRGCYSNQAACQERSDQHFAAGDITLVSLASKSRVDPQIVTNLVILELRWVELRCQTRRPGDQPASQRRDSGLERLGGVEDRVLGLGKLVDWLPVGDEIVEDLEPAV